MQTVFRMLGLVLCVAAPCPRSTSGPNDAAALDGHAAILALVA
jgi:hypothetical protein